MRPLVQAVLQELLEAGMTALIQVQDGIIFERCE